MWLGSVVTQTTILSMPAFTAQMTSQRLSNVVVESSDESSKVCIAVTISMLTSKSKMDVTTGAELMLTPTTGKYFSPWL
jgi:hypothetical protein